MAYEGKYAKKRSLNGVTPKEKNGFERFLDDHIRTIAAIGAILVVILLFAGIDALFRSNALTGNGSYIGEELSMQALNGLSEKTAPITWQDLDKISYTTMSETESDDGTYVLRRYSVAGGELSLLVGGFTDGEGYTGNIAYAEVKHIDHFDFSFSLLEDEDLLSYLDKFRAENPD